MTIEEKGKPVSDADRQMLNARVEQAGELFGSGYNCSQSVVAAFADLYGVDASRIYGECYGLNHLSYFQSIKVDGKEIMPELIANDEAYAKTDMRFFE